MKKVVAKIYGGIGNQLFCYAAARRLSIKNDCELVLDSVSGFVRDSAYDRNYQLDNFNIQSRKATYLEQLNPLSRIRRYILRKLNNYRPFNKRSYLLQEIIDFDKRLLELKFDKSLYIEGYWQSEKYFMDVESVIRTDLKIKAPVDNLNISMAEKIIKETSVAVHVRFFDDINFDAGNNASGDYYQQAILKMDKLVPGAHYFIFSDKPEVALRKISIPGNRLTSVKHNIGDANAFSDMWLMSQCQHFIIANSTFSWWGAWLSVFENKIIIAPGFEKRYGVSWWGFDGLLPSEWIKC